MSSEGNLLTFCCHCLNGGESMLPDGFAFEDCLLKHYIRKNVWLPLCRVRLTALNKASRGRRRLKYFTFCAVGALDVLLLDRAKIIKKSEAGEFDTVYFFDRSQESVVETRKRIPGANGFPGDFVKIVLQAQEGDELVEALDSPSNLQNTSDVRKSQMERAQLLKVIAAFPIDVINLDLEQYMFRSKEELPGQLVNALRRIFDWQKREGKFDRGRVYNLEEFTLMFTTQVGPPNLSANYLAYLRDTCLQSNLDENEQLRAPFLERSGGDTVGDFFDKNFDAAFKLAVPKSLTELALECDWHIDGKRGVEVFQFERGSKDGPYCMLHIAMTVRRQKPAREQRAPGQGIPDAVKVERLRTLEQLFRQSPIAVEALVTNGLEEELKSDLANLFEHRKKYYTTPAP
jgi:hypothetical protein